MSKSLITTQTFTVVDYQSKHRLIMEVPFGKIVLGQETAKDKVTLFVQFPDQTVRVLERCDPKPITNNGRYMRDHFKVIPGTKRRLTFYTQYLFLRVWIHRLADGSIQTTVESGHREELDILKGRNGETVPI